MKIEMQNDFNAVWVIEAGRRGAVLHFKFKWSALLATRE